MSAAESSSSSSQLFGMALLVFVNVVWVASSEITRYLFIDLDFKRPLFYTYAKSCMLSLFLLFHMSWNCCKSESEITKDKALYARLTEEEASSSEVSEDEEGTVKLELVENSLTEAEFEPISATDVESTTGEHSAPESQQSPKKAQSNQEQQKSETLNLSKCINLKRVRFNKLREVRRWPERLEEAAKQARLPYKKKMGSNENLTDILISLLPNTRSAMFIYIFYFAPLWLISSVTYQTALAYSSVSSVNLISTSAPLFVLMFGAFFGRHSADSFSWLKLVLVLLNMAGVCVVSRFSGTLFGSSLSLFSAFTNALYLFTLAKFNVRNKSVDMPLLLGTVGVFSLLACSPLIFFVHFSGIEPQLPLPTFQQWLVLVVNSFLGTLFADSVWLYATLLTGSLTSSISGSLAIPLSMFADSFFRNQPPNFWQILSSIPIMISFIGASILGAKSSSDLAPIPTEDEDFAVGCDSSAEVGREGSKEEGGENTKKTN